MTAIEPMSTGETRLRRRKSLAIACVLGLLVSLFYVVTIVRLKGNVAKRAQQQASGVVVPQPAAPATAALTQPLGQ